MLRETLLEASEEDAERLSDALLDAGALSVSLEDADRDSEQESPLYGEPGLEPEVLAWKRSFVKVLADAQFDVAAALEEIAMQLGIAKLKILSSVDVPDQDWVRMTQAQFSPVKVSDRLWIVPTWHTPPTADAINIRLDPGVAFGTGSHPTTHLCLKWLDSNLDPEANVLDYGCGTGILAIAASKLGAASVTGTDIDPQAVEAARSNAEANAVHARFVLPNDLTAGTFDTIVANILSNPLKLLAPALIGRLTPTGTLVLSGVLARQADEVIAVYHSHDPKLQLKVWAEQDGWVCIAGSRHS